MVIPGLIKLGYDPKDAHDYTVAACWEFIIPGVGAEIPNIAVMNYPLIVANTIDAHLSKASSFDSLMLAQDDIPISDSCSDNSAPAFYPPTRGGR